DLARAVDAGCIGAHRGRRIVEGGIGAAAFKEAMGAACVGVNADDLASPVDAQCTGGAGGGGIVGGRVVIDRHGMGSSVMFAFRPKIGGYAGCGVVSNDCSDASAASAAISKSSATPLPPPKPAIACTSWATSLEPPMDALDAVGGSTAKPPSCQSKPTAPTPPPPPVH